MGPYEMEDKTKYNLFKSYSEKQTQTRNEQRGLSRCGTAQSNLDVCMLTGRESDRDEIILLKGKF